MSTSTRSRTTWPCPGTWPTPWLRPDLEAITTTAGGEQDHWLLEVDLATENPARLLTKCHTYQDHLSSGTEQASNGGYYPQVVWLMNSTRRAGWLERQIIEDVGLLNELFVVVGSKEEMRRVVREEG